MSNHLLQTMQALCAKRREFSSLSIKQQLKDQVEGGKCIVK